MFWHSDCKLVVINLLGRDILHLCSLFDLQFSPAAQQQHEYKVNFVVDILWFVISLILILNKVNTRKQTLQRETIWWQQRLALVTISIQRSAARWWMQFKWLSHHSCHRIRHMGAGAGRGRGQYWFCAQLPAPPRPRPGSKCRILPVTTSLIRLGAVQLQINAIWRRSGAELIKNR